MQKQLREKLERLHELAGVVWEGDGGAEVSAELAEMRALTALMLAEPDRNCEVGTAEEQGCRCLAQFNQWRRRGDNRRLITAIMEWAQMPYEKGEKK